MPNFKINFIYIYIISDLQKYTFFLTQNLKKNKRNTREKGRKGEGYKQQATSRGKP
jgi:hypothetical protein